MRPLEKERYTYLGRAIIRGSLCLLPNWTPAPWNWLLNLFAIFWLVDLEQVPVPNWETVNKPKTGRRHLQSSFSFDYRGVTLFVIVKRWYYIAFAAVLAAGAVYIFLHRDQFGLGNLMGSAGARGTSGQPAPMQWKTVERVGDGFKIDLPAEPKDWQAPAFNEHGGLEQVRMIVANPDANTTFAVAWEDNPPVARVNSLTPDRTLNMARDGMLARTQTTILNESRSLQRGNPAMDVTARNRDGGILDARLIFSGARLYALMAMFPSANARRESDLSRFFGSFVPAASPVIPETMPAAAQD